MPTVAVHDLAVKDNSLAVATMGRSLYMFDHLNVLREWSSDISKGATHLFTAPDSIRWRLYDTYPEDAWMGDNPGGLATFYYWLKQAPKGDITIEILDSENHVINTLSSKPMPAIGYKTNLKDEEETAKKAALLKEPGIQVATWNLNYAGPAMIPKGQLDGGDPVYREPMVVPGTYTVRLAVDGQTQTTQLKVLPDPRSNMSVDDLKTQINFALGIRDDIGRLSRMVIQLESIRKQLEARNDLLKGNAKAADLITASNTLIDKLNAFEAKVQNPKAEIVYDILAQKGGAKLYSRLSLSLDYAVEADSLPPQGLKDAYAAQKQELDQYETEYKQIIASDFNTLNDSARKLDLPTVFIQ